MRRLPRTASSVFAAALLAVFSRAEDTIKIGEFASMTGKEATFGQFSHKGTQLAIEEVNGEPAAVVRTGGRAFSVITIAVADGQIRAVRVIANPDKLTHI